MSDAVARFAELVAEPSVDLGEAALVMAAGADHSVDVAEWLRVLDRLAEGVAGLEALQRRLFTELGLRGDTDSYYDPANSLLHRVLQRRRGIPITLAVVTLEVGRRAGVEVEGVGMPGHFLVRAEGVLIDPFDRGAVLDDAAAEALFRATNGAGDEVPFSARALLPTVGPREILHRMLANLRSLYRAAGEASQLEWVVRMRLAMGGASTMEVAELGEALAAQGRLREGAQELERRAESDDLDADTLRAAALALRARLN